MGLVCGFGLAREVPLAEADQAPGRCWNPRDITDSCVVDTAGIGPLTIGHGDSDGRAPRSGGWTRPPRCESQDETNCGRNT